ncbi:MAG: 2-amino-4-hydroxy-6-hydroxymethyldihydropteridine diphosphokinase [Gammaproteobacteria bacterium]|nr:2-amino-4-hydroxy-6-hydroxymethyldihydropteridine diphosphokinase [Gammaproteobacteria bacterium]MDH3560636.1 2-amino-4-hydroxy-6-hydroxymethyldihydropteridine diphosphokinase [Gammaproteobacteria bacterium]
MARVYLSMGSNIDREQHIASALSMLSEAFGPLERSSVYESEAVGFDSPAFYNLVVGFDTDKGPRAVQRVLRHIEEQNDRVRTEQLSARTLDLDLLLYDDLLVDEEGLKLPHNDIARYAFVLGPLAEIAGSERHPLTGERFDTLWYGFDDSDQMLTRIDWPPAEAS